MSEHTPNLSLPLLMPSQAQKHVTHNEALCMLDMLCQLSAKDVHVDNAPITPAQGDVYLLGSAPTGDWNGQAHAIAAYDGVGWRFVTPRTGWRAFVESSGGRLMYFNGANWVALEAAGGGGGSGDGGGTFDGEVAALGIGTPADPATPFLAELNTGRFTARAQNDGGTGSMTLALNKTGAGSDVGIVFEDDATPFARLGRFASPTTDLAVSADGTNFLTAFAIDPLNGSVRQPGIATVQGRGRHGYSAVTEHLGQAGCRFCPVQRSGCL